MGRKLTILDRTRYMSDKVADLLRHVSTSKVEIMLSEQNVVSGIPDSGFWPRVTISIPGKFRTFPLTYYKQQTKQTSSILSELEVEILILVSGGSKTDVNHYGRKRELRGAAARIQGVIERAILKASTKDPMATRHAAASRRYRKNKFLQKFKDFCKTNGYGVEYEDIRPSELGKVWDDVRRTKLAESVMDS